MIDASTDQLTRSPSFILSQLPDPTLISTVCRPLIQSEISADSFSLNLAYSLLIPNMKELVKRNNFEAMKQIPKLTKLIVDNYNEEGLDLVMQEILPCLHQALDKSGSKTSHELMHLITETLCSINSKYRDSVLTEVIVKDSSNNDCKYRQLAAYLIPYVRNSKRVLTNFRSLSLDRVPSVRIEVVKSLPHCHFDQELIEYVLINASKDMNVQTRRTAASLFGEIAPHLVEQFIDLLRNPDTMRYALKSVKNIVIANSLSRISGALIDCLMFDPDAVAPVLLNLSRIVNENEKQLLLNLTYKIRYCPTIIQYLGKFSQVYPDKSPFIDFFDPRGISNWRVRKLMVDQAKLFVDDFHSRLCEYALMYSRDEVAVIRNESISLWKLLIKDDAQCKIKVTEALLPDIWQSRLVLAKLIAEIGIDSCFEKAAETLSHDPVSNVRFGFASRIVGTPYFDTYFGDSSDIEIQKL